MKKGICSLAVLVLAFALTACSPADSNNRMSIEKAELSAEEQSILELVGTEKTPYILDFIVDETVQSLQINIYELQNNGWRLVSGGGGQELEEAGGRVALTFDNIGFGIRTAVQNKGSSSYTTEPDFNFDGLGAATSYLTDKTTIEYEKKIPLVIQIHTSKNEIVSLSPEYGFYEPGSYSDLGYEKIYAITCLFSQKSVNERSALPSQS